MNTSYQRFRRFAAVLVGIVFLASGLLKMIDPVGTMLILTRRPAILRLSLTRISDGLPTL